MTTLEITVLVILGATLVGLLLLLFLPSDRKAPSPEDALDIRAEGSIVTVRKVGHVTSVTIRGGIHDHWEGDEGVSLPYLQPEVTRREVPELYAEYMSPSTSAVRRYEIIEEVYAMGFTLPYIRGLSEQYKKEVREAIASGDPDSRAVLERTPVDLGAERAEGDGYTRLDINDALRHEPMEDMGPSESGEHQEIDNT